METVKIQNSGNLIKEKYNRKNTFRGKISLPEDKIELQNKKASSNTGKILLILGIVSAVGLGIYKRKSLKNLFNKIFNKNVKNNNVETDKKYLNNIDELKESFSKIFDRDFTKDEANEIALKYKEIFETKDDTQFMGKIFSQLQQDYKLPDTPYIIGKTDEGLYASWSLFNGVTYNKKLVQCVEENGKFKFVNVNRRLLSKSLAHELKHATQDKLANQVNLQQNIMAYIEREQRLNTPFWKRNLAQYGNDVSETKTKLAENFYNQMISSYKNLEKIPEDSPLYNKGLNYINGQRNYIRATDNYQAYRHQLIEEEAHEAGDIMERIYTILTNQ